MCYRFSETRVASICDCRCLVVVHVVVTLRFAVAGVCQKLGLDLRLRWYIVAFEVGLVRFCWLVRIAARSA